MAMKRKDLMRFWEKVSVRGPNECWLWSAGTSTGYGRFRLNGRSEQASRLSWIIHNGSIKKGMEVMHNCLGGDNKLCVNPKHLLLGTPKQHAADRIAKGQTNPARGDRHGRHTRPDRTARGSRHGSVTHPESRPCGESHPKAKLTKGEVRSILKRLRAGESVTEIANSYQGKVGRTAIDKIKNGVNWKCVVGSNQR